MFAFFRARGGNGSQPASQWDSISWIVRRDYLLPRKVVVRSLEVLDSEDSPDKPGMMFESTLLAMVERFDKVFGNRATDARKQARTEQVENVMSHLQRHTRRRRGDQFVQEKIVEWEQTKKVYELFRVDLNVFERIYFTVDVSESTAILSQLCSCFLVLMIMVSIVIWMVSTLPSAQQIPPGCISTEVNQCAPEPDAVFDTIEQLCVYVFTAEYLVRLFTVHSVRFPLLNETFLEGVLTGKSTSSSLSQKESMTPDKSGISNQRNGRTEASVGPADRGEHFQLPGKLQNTLKHVMGLANLIDLFAILPFWIEKLQSSEGSDGSALMVLRILRLTRIFRVFKLGKYNEVFTLFSRVISQSVPALSLMLFFITLGCCLFGTLIWFAEQGSWYPEGNPKLLSMSPPIEGRGAYLRPAGTLDDTMLEESPFYSIIHSFWYVIVTITTVGYGDIAPTTLAGKIVGSLTILNGIIVLAMPIGVVGANFSSEYYRVQDERKRRIKLKQQMKTRAQVEEEQDAALREAQEASEGASLAVGSHTMQRGIELCRVGTARRDILVFAEAMDEGWHNILPPVMYVQLSHSLKKFAQDISHISPTGENGAGEATPVVSLALLESLDVLTARVHRAISTVTSTEELAEFGLSEAKQLRHDWADFCDRCWAYVIDMCHVEKAPDPPEFYQMKAHLELAGALPPVVARSSQHDAPRPAEPAQEPGGADAASGQGRVSVADESAGSSRVEIAGISPPDHLVVRPPSCEDSKLHPEPGSSVGASTRVTSSLPGLVPCDAAVGVSSEEQ